MTGRKIAWGILAAVVFGPIVAAVYVRGGVLGTLVVFSIVAAVAWAAWEVSG